MAYRGLPIASIVQVRVFEMALRAYMTIVSLISIYGFVWRRPATPPPMMFEPPQLMHCNFGLERQTVDAPCENAPHPPTRQLYPFQFRQPSHMSRIR